MFLANCTKTVPATEIFDATMPLTVAADAMQIKECELETCVYSILLYAFVYFAHKAILTV